VQALTIAVPFVIAAVAYIWLFYTTNEIKGRSLGGWILNVVVLIHELPFMWMGNDDFSRVGILDRVPILLATAVILGTGYLAGRLLMQFFRAESALTVLEQTILAIGVGLNTLSLYILLVGLAGGLRNRLVMLAPIVLVAVAAAFRRRDLWRARPRTPTNGSRPVHAAEQRVAFWISIPFAVTMIAGAILPPWHFDAREYHAEIPKEWYQQGRIAFVPHNVYGNMPLAAELHGITGMNMMRGEAAWWYGTLVGEAVIASYALLTALLIFAFGVRFLSPPAGALAALIYISTPWIAYVSTAGLIDGVSAFYLFASCYVFLIWKQPTGEATANSRSLILIMGFLAGSAVGCKYPAVVFVVAPLGAGVLLLGARRFDLKAAAVFTIAVAVACGPWFVKNAVLADNPTYPLLSDVFGGKTRTPEKNRQWQRAHRVPEKEHGHAFGLSDMRASAEMLLVESDYASPLLVPLMIMSLFARRHRSVLTLLAVMIAFNVVAWWCLTHRVDRFLVPILPLAALLCGAGATWSDEVVWHRCSRVLILVVTAINLVFVISPLCSQDIRFLVSYREIRNDIPHNPAFDINWVHPAHRYLNETVRPPYRAMLVGEAQVFDMEVPILYNTCFDDCVFEKAMKGLSKEQRIAAFRDQHVSHVFIFWQELDRYRRSYDYSDYVTPELIQREFIATGILKEIPMPTPRASSQLFEVDGWRKWAGE